MTDLALPTGVLKPDVERAMRTLLTRGERMRRRASRARINSNERQRCVWLASQMHASALMLADDKKLQKDLRERELLSRGWRALAEAIAVWASKRKASR